MMAPALVVVDDGDALVPADALEDGAAVALTHQLHGLVQPGAHPHVAGEGVWVSNNEGYD